jgi:hypothetical protein
MLHVTHKPLVEDLVYLCQFRLTDLPRRSRQHFPFHLSLLIPCLLLTMAECNDSVLNHNQELDTEIVTFSVI